MMEYLAEDRVLFSNDGFAAHLSSDTLWADEVDQKELEVEFHEYWDKIMRPWSSYIRRNMPKLDDFDIEVVAPSHGPIYRKNARDRLDRYKEWAADKSEGGNRVTIFYTSNYGNTKSMAERFAGELDKHGLKATLAEVTETDPDKARDLVESSRAIMIGTPTFNGDAVKPIWDLVSLFSSIERFGKKAAVFGSYGWGGEAPKMVAERLTGLKLKVYEKPYTARLIPSDDDLDQLTAYAEGFAEFIEAEK
jgi:flavorubredoxin